MLLFHFSIFLLLFSFFLRVFVHFSMFRVFAGIANGLANPGSAGVRVSLAVARRPNCAFDRERLLHRFRDACSVFWVVHEPSTRVHSSSGPDGAHRGRLLALVRHYRCRHASVLGDDERRRTSVSRSASWHLHRRAMLERHDLRCCKQWNSCVLWQRVCYAYSASSCGAHRCWRLVDMRAEA